MAGLKRRVEALERQFPEPVEANPWPALLRHATDAELDELEAIATVDRQRELSELTTAERATAERIYAALSERMRASTP